MKRSYKFRIYPNAHQSEILDQTLNTCRIFYNNSLDERRFVYINSGESISYRDQQDALPSRKEHNDFLSQIHSQVLQDVLHRVDRSFKNFFRRVKQNQKVGFPRFKGKNRYTSFVYPQSGFVLNDNHLQLSKIGSIRIKKHRAIPINAKIKTCTLKKNVDHWFVSFSVELPDPSTPTKAIKLLELIWESPILLSYQMDPRYKILNVSERQKRD